MKDMIAETRLNEYKMMAPWPKMERDVQRPVGRILIENI